MKRHDFLTMTTRLFVSGELINGAVRELEGDKARYLGRVLRLRPGDAIRVFNGDGPEHEAVIETITKSVVSLRIGESVEAQTESPFRIHLVQGVSRVHGSIVLRTPELGCDPS